MADSSKIWIVVPNWNGAELLPECLSSLQKQTYETVIIVVDNASSDNSVEIIESKFPDVTLLKNSKNLGFAGGVNTGIRYALEKGANGVALFNSDAVADPDWLKYLASNFDKNPDCGIVTGKILKKSGWLIDNTGECFSVWGLPFARSRNQDKDSSKPGANVFGASGGSTLYSAKMLRSIGLFDEDFFAYYEDADMNWRAQLSGWKVRYESQAIVHHAIGATSSKISGLTTYQTIKNLPWVITKNIPARLLPAVLPRFALVYSLILGKALFSKRFPYAFKGFLVSLIFTPKKIIQRNKIQRHRKVPNAYIKSLLTHNLPPDSSLRKLTKLFRA